MYPGIVCLLYHNGNTNNTIIQYNNTCCFYHSSIVFKSGVTWRNDITAVIHITARSGIPQMPDGLAQYSQNRGLNYVH